MSRRPRGGRPARPAGSRRPPSAEAGRDAPFRAGCGRERLGPADLPELAYRELAYPECPTCVHRLEPDGAPPFCRWRPAGAAHPFAGLAGLRDAVGEAEGAGEGDEREEARFGAGGANGGGA